MNAPHHKVIEANMSHFTEGPLTIDETAKIVSLLENPPEAAHVRKALRLYELPERLQNPQNYKWGDSSKLMQVIFHFMNPQHPEEIEPMLEYVKGCTSLLEVGSSFGGTLKRMAALMPVGSRIVSVDLDCDDTPRFLKPLDSLRETCRQIAAMGAKVDLIIGNSHKPEVIERVQSLGPFDFVFIDGDHSYTGVRQDWENYGHLGRKVSFHDIYGLAEVRRFWGELKSDPKLKDLRFEEFIGKNSALGIGIVHRD